jgi:hypothetical protein
MIADPGHMGDEALIVSQFFQALLGNAREKKDGVALALVPETGVNTPKKFECIPLPAPP